MASDTDEQGKKILKTGDLFCSFAAPEGRILSSAG
jgi:hypothetical protein